MTLDKFDELRLKLPGLGQARPSRTCPSSGHLSGPNLSKLRRTGSHLFRTPDSSSGPPTRTCPSSDFHGPTCSGRTCPSSGWLYFTHARRDWCYYSLCVRLLRAICERLHRPCQPSFFLFFSYFLGSFSAKCWLGWSRGVGGGTVRWEGSVGVAEKSI